MATNRIDCIGNVILPGRSEVTHYTTEVIRNLNVQKTKTELHSLIAFCSVLAGLYQTLLALHPRLYQDLVGRR